MTSLDLYADSTPMVYSLGATDAFAQLTPDQKLYAHYMSRATELLDKVGEAIVAPDPAALGYPSSGSVSCYYPGSPTITPEEIKTISWFLLSEGIFLENTRLRKIDMGNGPPGFQVLVASAEAPATEVNTFKLPENAGVVKVFQGDHAPQLRDVGKSIEQALPFARSEQQRLYLQRFMEYFRTGNVLDQKSGSIAWVEDESPPVETIVGFIEPYRDPAGIRWEWMGLVALQNEEKTKIFHELADHAEIFIQEMPWTQIEFQSEQGRFGPFENDIFIRPDFVSLEILSFCVPNCWTGIAAPTFPDIRASHGRKNMYFSNRAAAFNASEHVPFISPADYDQYLQTRHLSFEVIVAAHELIGHGCGKILEESQPGVFNFDPQNPPTDPLTGMKVNSWYKPTETPKSVLGPIYNAINECLAESIALYLISNHQLLDIFKVGQKTTLDYRTFEYHTYLQIISMGIGALLSYDSATAKWGQAHDRARFGMVKCLHQAGQGLLEIREHNRPEEDPDLEIILNKDLISSVARPSLSTLIMRLQIYRCTANVNATTDYMEELTSVNGQYARWRAAVLAKKQKRPLFVQANTVLGEDHSVDLKEYPATLEGLIQSWVDRDI
ncbi:dipeptidyl peptidase III [Penicillium herquei]|nr:dipeptidyl peptidase III [Penicillium herquei]